MTIEFPTVADEWAVESAESAGFDSDALEVVCDWLKTSRSSSFFGIHEGRSFVERHWRPTRLRPRTPTLCMALIR